MFDSDLTVINNWITKMQTAEENRTTINKYFEFRSSALETDHLKAALSHRKQFFKN